MRTFDILSLILVLSLFFGAFAMQDIKEQAKETGERVQEQAQQTYEATKEKASILKDALKEKADTAADFASSQFKQAKESVTETVETANPHLHGHSQEVRDEKGKSFFQTGKQKLHDIREKATGMFRGVSGKGKGAARRAAQAKRRLSRRERKGKVPPSGPQAKKVVN
jgi:gas vesicle protein